MRAEQDYDATAHITEELVYISISLQFLQLHHQNCPWLCSMISCIDLYHGDKPELIFLIQICIVDHFAGSRLLSLSLVPNICIQHGKN